MHFSLTWFLQGHQVSIATRLKYFDYVMTTMACFAAGHRALYKNDFVNMHASYRNMPTNCWTSTWHKLEFRMAGNQEIFLLGTNGLNISQHWPVSNLGRRVLAHIIVNSRGMWPASLHTDGPNGYSSWAPQFRTSSKQLGSKQISYCRYKNFGNWVDAAEDQPWLAVSFGRLHLLLPALSGYFWYILCYLFTCHFFFTPVPTWARHFFGGRARLGSTRLICFVERQFSFCVPCPCVTHAMI